MSRPIVPAQVTSRADTAALTGVDEALARILAVFSPLDAVDLPILECDGLVLAQDVVAEVDIPPFTNSAMDGYAVRAIDTAGATRLLPVALTITGSAHAGTVEALTILPGMAVRIMTGAPLPGGADAVVQFEETNEGAHGHTILIYRAASPGGHARDKGEDIRAGTTVLRAGHLVRPAEIGLLAALNHVTVSVVRRPRVAILATGDEIVEPGGTLKPGQVRNSNSHMLAAMAKRFGAIPLLLGVAGDNIIDLSRKLKRASSFDLIVTSGGVSHGDYDLVKDYLKSEGEVEIWHVAIKPGKPLAFGRIGGVPLLGLPGNPAAAAVCFEQFGRPAIKRMQGRSDLYAPVIQAVLTDRIENHGRRRHFVRASVARTGAGQYVVSTARRAGAGAMASLVRSNGLLVIPEELEVAEPGMTLSVQMSDWIAELPLPAPLLE